MEVAMKGQWLRNKIPNKQHVCQVMVVNILKVRNCNDLFNWAENLNS